MRWFYLFTKLTKLIRVNKKRNTTKFNLIKKQIIITDLLIYIFQTCKLKNCEIAYKVIIRHVHEYQTIHIALKQSTACSYNKNKMKRVPLRLPNSTDCHFHQQLPVKWDLNVC